MKLRDIDQSAFETWVDERDHQPKYFAPKFKRDEFFNTRRWLDLRAKVLSYYGRMCMKCTTKIKIIQVDHIKPRSLYPELEFTFSNLQVLCIDCNRDKGVITEDYRSRIDRLRANLEDIT